MRRFWLRSPKWEPAQYHRRLVFAWYPAARKQQRTNKPPGTHSKPFPAHSRLTHMTDCPQKERGLGNSRSNLFAPPCSPKCSKLRQPAKACSPSPKWRLTPRSQTLALHSVSGMLIGRRLVCLTEAVDLAAFGAVVLDKGSVNGPLL